MYAPQPREPGRLPTSIEKVTINLLRVGTSLAAGLMALGLALLLAWPAGIAGLQPAGLIELGVLVLILTPVLRLVAALLIYVREGDRAFTAISGLILGLIILGAALGLLE